MTARSWAQVRQQIDSRLGNKAPCPFPQYANDPEGFSREVLGFTPWEKQAAIGKSLVEEQRVTVVSCNGAGKTCWAARILLWFLYTRRDAIVVTTAPTWHQVGLLWREVRAAFSSSKFHLKGELMQTRLDLEPQHFAMGLSTDKEERFQGFHAKGSEPGGDGGLLVIVDEASGVADHIFDAMRGYLTSPNCYVLLIGNGNRSEGAFYESHQRGRWDRFSIAAHDVPEDIMSRDWITEQGEYWGEDSPQYFVRVLGKFPPKGGDYQLIPQWLIEGALEEEPTANEGRHIGVDVARSGADSSVAVITVDGVIKHTDRWDSEDLMETAKRTLRLAAQWNVPGENIHVDMDGLGAGVVDRIREEGSDCDPVDFGGKPLGDWDWLVGTEVKILNRRAELHWIGRMALLNHHAQIPEEYKPTVWRQLAWTNFEYNEKGLLKMESKDKIRARFGASPDFADAWYLTLSRARNRPKLFII